MDAPLVVEIDVAHGVTGLARADGGVEVEPLPHAPAGDEGEDVDVDVVDDASGDDLGGLGPVLAVGAGLAGEVVGGVGAAGLRADHGGVGVEVGAEVGHDLAAELHVVLLGAGEVEREAAVVAAAVALHVLDVVAGQLQGKRDRDDRGDF